MPLEQATYLANLNSAWPVGSDDFVFEGDDHLRGLKGTLQRSFPGQAFPVMYGVDTGVNAMVIEPSPAPSALVDGMRLWVRKGSRNTSTVTLNVGSLGVKPVVDMWGRSIQPGVFAASSIVPLVYDGILQVFRWAGLNPAGEDSVILNPLAKVWQLGESFTGVTTTTYSADQWVSTVVGATVTISRSTDTPGNVGSSVLTLVTTPKPTPAVSDRLTYQFRLEGTAIERFAWGTSDFASVTFGFFIKADQIGTGSVSFRRVLADGTIDRSYVVSFTVSAVGVWERKVFFVPGDSAVGWLSGAGEALKVDITLMAGTGLQTATEGSWHNGDFRAVLGQSNFAGVANAEVRVWGPRLFIGDFFHGLNHEPLSETLSLLYRYLEPVAGYVVDNVSSKGAPVTTYKVMKRIQNPSPLNFTYGVGSGATFVSLNWVNPLSGGLELGVEGLLGRGGFRQSGSHSADSSFHGFVDARM